MPVDADAGRVYALISQPDRLADFVPGIRSVTLSEVLPSELQYEWNLEIEGAPIRLVQDWSVFPGERKVRTSSIEGDLVFCEGEWTVEEHDAGSELRARIQYRLGIPIEPYVSGVFHRKFTRFMEDLLQAIKEKVEQDAREGGAA